MDSTKKQSRKLFVSVLSLVALLFLFALVLLSGGNVNVLKEKMLSTFQTDKTVTSTSNNLSPTPPDSLNSVAGVAGPTYDNSYTDNAFDLFFAIPSEWSYQVRTSSELDLLDQFHNIQRIKLSNGSKRVYIFKFKESYDIFEKSFSPSLLNKDTIETSQTVTIDEVEHIRHEVWQITKEDGETKYSLRIVSYLRNYETEKKTLTESNPLFLVKNETNNDFREYIIFYYDDLSGTLEAGVSMEDIAKIYEYDFVQIDNMLAKFEPA